MVYFPPFCTMYKEDNICDFLFAFLTPSPSKKGSTLKRGLLKRGLL